MKTRLTVPIFTALIWIGCGVEPHPEARDTATVSKEEQNIPAMASSPEAGNASDFFSSQAAKINLHDSSRKFIRTADLKFRVNNVLDVTIGIEDQVMYFGGFVTLSNLYSTKIKTQEVKVSKDSSLRIITYRTENEMVLRVPVAQLDSTLRAIGKFSVFMDYRIIKADEITLSLLANQKEKERQQDYQASLDKKPVENQADRILNSRRAEDQATLNNLELYDKVSYSTIKVLIYQDVSTSQYLVPNEKEISSYGPGFGEKFVDALEDGWSIVEHILLFFTRFWVFILVMLTGAFLIWRFSRK